jgi:hypothetical protein
LDEGSRRITDSWDVFLEAEGGPINNVGAGGRLDLLLAFVVVDGGAVLTAGDAIFASLLLLSLSSILLACNRNIVPRILLLGSRQM